MVDGDFIRMTRILNGEFDHDDDDDDDNDNVVAFSVSPQFSRPFQKKELKTSRKHQMRDPKDVILFGSNDNDTNNINNEDANFDSSFSFPSTTASPCSSTRSVLSSSNQDVIMKNNNNNNGVDHGDEENELYWPLLPPLQISSSSLSASHLIQQPLSTSTDVLMDTNYHPPIPFSPLLFRNYQETDFRPFDELLSSSSTSLEEDVSVAGLNQTSSISTSFVTGFHLCPNFEARSIDAAINNTAADNNSNNACQNVSTSCSTMTSMISSYGKMMGKRTRKRKLTILEPPAVDNDPTIIHPGLILQSNRRSQKDNELQSKNIFIKFPLRLLPHSSDINNDDLASIDVLMSDGSRKCIPLPEFRKSNPEQFTKMQEIDWNPKMLRSKNLEEWQKIYEQCKSKLIVMMMEAKNVI